MSKHIVHFSVGTLVFLFVCFGVVGAALVTGAVIISHTHYEASIVQSIDEMPNGELGPISRAIIERKMSSEEMESTWGALDTKRLAETKQGWLIDRLRARRSASCQSRVQYQSPVSYRQARCSFRRASSPYQPMSMASQRCVPCYPASSDPNLPSPMPRNPNAQVNPIDVTPSVPRRPTPDISSLPPGIQPSVKSSYCEDGNCSRIN